MYIQCTFNNNVSHNVHCDFFNVSRMYVPMYMRSTCRYIKCSSQIDLMYIFSDVHEMYVKFLADKAQDGDKGSRATAICLRDTKAPMATRLAWQLILPL